MNMHAYLTPAERKENLLALAKANGNLHFSCSPPPEARELVKAGQLVRVSYLVYTLPTA